MTSKTLIKRRNFLKTSGSLAGISALPWMSPSLAIGADRTITLALPNNPANFDPAHQANHDTMACSQVVFEWTRVVDGFSRTAYISRRRSRTKAARPCDVS